MKLNLKSAVFAVVPLALAACNGLELGETQGMQPGGSAFDKALFEGYVARAQHEYGYGNYTSSDAFALKAQAAAAGDTPAPWAPNSPNEHPPGLVPDAELGAMTDGRGKLMAALGDGAGDRLPADAATAQVMYDCWIEEESYIDDWAEASQPEHAAECRDGFWAALDKITKKEPMAAIPNFLVFFDWDSSVLTPAAREVIQQAAEEFRRANATGIMTVGHADTSGSTAYNNGLSERRAEAVQGALSSLGVPGPDIDVTWRGESDPLVATPDGVREPQNRRVEILLER